MTYTTPNVIVRYDEVDIEWNDLTYRLLDDNVPNVRRSGGYLLCSTDEIMIDIFRRRRY